MATPLAHGLAGYGVYLLAAPRRERSGVALAIACAVAGIAPDLDFIPGIALGSPALFHQGISHSLAAAAVAGALLASLPVARETRWRERWGILTLAYASHLVLDLFGPDRRAPYGIPLLWPITDATFLAPITLLPGVRHARTTTVETAEWIRRVLDPRNLMALLIEAGVFVPFVVLARAARRRAGARAGTAGQPSPDR
ncbi:MAG TPA: metal-dependent hydrolase [Candidatus Eisenbacteria bacterium]|nr:metal-dependent hydrolase [Candidatus Eisenbacteria bacterium]